MNDIQIKRTFCLLIVLIITVSLCEAQRPAGSTGRPGRAIFGRSDNTSEGKRGEPRSVSKAKKKQEANERRLKKEYSEYVKESRKRAVKIQTPEVQERMIQNRKDANKRYKLKKKKREESFRRSGQKF